MQDVWVDASNKDIYSSFRRCRCKKLQFTNTLCSSKHSSIYVKLGRCNVRIYKIYEIVNWISTSNKDIYSSFRRCKCNRLHFKRLLCISRYSPKYLSWLKNSLYVKFGCCDVRIYKIYVIVNWTSSSNKDIYSSLRRCKCNRIQFTNTLSSIKHSPKYLSSLKTLCMLNLGVAMLEYTRYIWL